MAAAVREKCGQGDIVVRDQGDIGSGRYWPGRSGTSGSSGRKSGEILVREIFLVREILLSGREVGSSGRKSNVW